MHPNDGRVVSNFIVQALRGQPITVYGKGEQTRSFCYVDDLIEGFLRFMALEAPCPGPINLGNPGEFTILQLAQQVIALTGSKSKIVFAKLPVDDPMLRRPDITIAQEKLGWVPRIDLEAGLVKTIAYFDELLTSGAATHPADAATAPRRRVNGRSASGRSAVLAA
jgi:UDP-glucuronate decarboxylase